MLDSYYVHIYTHMYLQIHLRFVMKKPKKKKDPTFIHVQKKNIVAGLCVWVREREIARERGGECVSECVCVSVCVCVCLCVCVRLSLCARACALI